MECQAAALTALSAAIIIKICRRRAKKDAHVEYGWSHGYVKKQELSHVNLIRELQDIPEDWKNYLRMNKETHLDLLERITPLIKKQDTVMRSAITPHDRLAAILRFLITGGSLELKLFIIPQSRRMHVIKASNWTHGILVCSLCERQCANSYFFL